MIVTGPRRIGPLFILFLAAACTALAATVNPVLVARFLNLSGLPVALAALLWTLDASLLVMVMLLVRRRRDARLQQNLALLVASVALMLLAGEGALRAVDFRPGVLTLFRPDPGGRGSFRLKPDLSLTMPMAGRVITLRTNSLGMRWRDVNVAPPDSVRRVAFVGDSFTFGLWADDETRSFVGITDSLLAPQGFEALNFGVPGYGLGEVELIIQDEVLRFRPAFVVLSFYAGNDFLDTYLGPRRYDISRSGALDTDWQYVESQIPPEYRGRNRDPLVTRFYLYGVMRAAVKAAWPRAAEATGRLTDGAAIDRSYSSNLFWSRAEYPPFADTARAMSLAALGRIADVVARAGARLMIVAVPSIEQVDLPAIFGTEYDIDRPQRFVEDFARARSLPYVDLLPVLTSYASAGIESYVRHDGHFGNEGHRIAGETIAAMIRTVDRRSREQAGRARTLTR